MCGVHIVGQDHGDGAEGEGAAEEGPRQAGRLEPAEGKSTPHLPSWRTPAHYYGHCPHPPQSQQEVRLGTYQAGASLRAHHAEEQGAALRAPPRLVLVCTRILISVLYLDYFTRLVS